MGDVAEMMLDGTFCQQCGTVFDDIAAGAETPGYPRTCNGCKYGGEGYGKLNKKHWLPVPEARSRSTDGGRG